MNDTLLLQQAQIAIKAGQKKQAHQLLQQAIRQNPQDHTAWLLLARVTPSPGASLNYVKRAEMLKPDDLMVQQARAWAERRALAATRTNGNSRTAVQQTTQPPKRNWQTVAIWGGIAITLAFLAGLLLWSSFGRQLQSVATSQAALPETAGGGVVANNQAILPDNREMAPPELAEAIVTASPTPPRIRAKNIALAAAGGGHSPINDPRPTWTLTPMPTNTPTPTPSPVPTFVSSLSQKPAGRPLGVGPDERWVDVDLSQQTLYVYEGNDLIFETLISGGLPEYPTVTGQFRIWLRYESQTMDGRRLGYDYYLPDVPYVMYFFEDYALHGTYWHNNFGTPMSHGCVNMRIEDAEWVFSWSRIGTVVNVHE